jgi:phosphopantetheine--protein transferase-like protein
MPIFWSFQNINTRIGESELSDPILYLGEQEKEIFQKLKFPKRKGEWLGARLLAKDLIRTVDKRCSDKELHEIEVLNEKSGAPYLVVSGGQGNPGKVSLSHSNGVALCSYSPDDIQLGIDLELVESRSREFVEDYFTPAELDQVAKLPTDAQQLFVTVIWSGKESALKALSSGLRVDTRSVEVILPEFTIKPGEWNNLGLKSNLIKNNSLSLVWRREGEFVITACIPQNNVKELIRVEF